MSNYKEIAERLYKTYKMNIIPLKNGQKMPKTKWKKYIDNRQSEKEVLEMPFHDLTGLAIILGPVSNHLVCIDIDAPKIDSVSKKILEILALPEDYAWHVKSANGGDHIYFYCKELISEYNKGVIVLNGLDFDCKQIELRIKGCLMVAPHSRLESGRIYTFKNKNSFDKPISAVKIQDLKQFLVAYNYSESKNEVAKNEHIDKIAVNNDTNVDEKELAKASSCVNQIIERRINICETYDNWLKIGMSLAYEFGSLGKSLFHSISRISNKYKTDECENYYTKLCQSQLREISNPVTIGTFYFICKKYKIFPSINEEQKKKQGSKDKSQWQVATELVLHHYQFEYDTLTSTLFSNGQKFDERDFNALYVDLVNTHNLPRVSKEFIYSILESTHIPRFNRIERLFKNYAPKKTDGNIKRLAETLVTITGEEILIELNGRSLPYKEAIIELYLVKMVKQFFENDANEFCLVLLGEMAIGKTSWFTRLLPQELSELVRITQFTKDKDFKVQLTESLLLVIDEIRERDMASNEFMKLTMSTPNFPLRVPYARKPQLVKRVATLAGTGNNHSILRDPTGNRRFICLWLDDIDKELFNSIDKTDLLFEAYTLYKNGYETRVPACLLEAINNVSKDFEIENESDAFLSFHFPPAKIEKHDTAWYSVLDLKKMVEAREEKTLSFFHINNTLTRLGYKSKIIRRKSRLGNNSKVRHYLCENFQNNPEVNVAGYHIVSEDALARNPEIKAKILAMEMDTNFSNDYSNQDYKFDS